MKKALVIFLLCVVFLYLNLTPFVRMTRGYVAFLLNPISYIFVTGESEVADFFTTVRSINKIKSENNLLKDSLQKTQTLVVIKESKDALNNFEDRQKEFLSDKGGLVVAEVVGTYEDENGKYLDINKGLESGVSEGDTVAYNGYLLGRVVSAFPNKATISLTYFSKLEIPAKNADSSSTGLVICTKGTCIFDKVLTSEALSLGDLITTSGIGGAYTSDLLLGEVLSVDESPEKLFKSAKIQSALDTERINKVIVITNE